MFVLFLMFIVIVAALAAIFLYSPDGACPPHDWTDWRPGTYRETYFGKPTGRTAAAEGRTCNRCGKLQHRG